jgi:hypothetical protein
MFAEMSPRLLALIAVVAVYFNQGNSSELQLHVRSLATDLVQLLKDLAPWLLLAALVWWVLQQMKPRFPIMETPSVSSTNAMFAEMSPRLIAVIAVVAFYFNQGGSSQLQLHLGKFATDMVQLLKDLAPWLLLAALVWWVLQQMKPRFPIMETPFPGHVQIAPPTFYEGAPMPTDYVPAPVSTFSAPAPVFTHAAPVRRAQSPGRVVFPPAAAR